MKIIYNVLQLAEWTDDAKKHSYMLNTNRHPGADHWATQAGKEVGRFSINSGGHLDVPDTTRVVEYCNMTGPECADQLTAAMYSKTPVIVEPELMARIIQLLHSMK